MVRFSSRRSMGIFQTATSQIGLGATTMRQVGAHLGSVVHVTVSLPSGGRRTVPFRVVSQISFPVARGGVVSLGTGAAFTIAGYEAAVCPPGPRQTACRQAVARTTRAVGSWPASCRVHGGRLRSTTISTSDSSSLALPITPTSLINFGEAVNFPLIFGAMLAVFGAATLGPSASGERLAPPTRSRASEGAGVRERPGCLGGGLAGDDIGPCRHRHRRPAWAWWSVRRCGGRSPTTWVLSRSPSCRSGSSLYW